MVPVTDQIKIVTVTSFSLPAPKKIVTVPLFLLLFLPEKCNTAIALSFMKN
jgi:hypothetical protein